MSEPRSFALLTVDGTAMGETALKEEDMNDPQMVEVALELAAKAGDWDGNTVFTDVTGNDAIWEILYGDEAGDFGDDEIEESLKDLKV